MKIKLSVLISFFIFCEACLAQSSTCARKAQINYQDVLVDSSSNLKGEGLRYYLAKDSKSLKYLEEYQNKSKSSWRSAALSTTGTGLMLLSILRPSEGKDEEFTGRSPLLIGGISMVLISFLISKNNEINNEHLLLRSIEEYNKRNTPKIYFAPTTNNSNEGQGLSVGLMKDF